MDVSPVVSEGRESTVRIGVGGIASTGNRAVEFGLRVWVC